MGRIIAVVNQKGGVGKTTTAVNLTAALKEAGKRVLLCDFDPQANATSGLGLDKRHLRHSIYDVIINEVPAENAIVHTDYGDVLVIPNMGLPVFMLLHYGVAYFVAKMPQETKNSKNVPRLKKR